MICCYLVHSNQFPNAESALTYYGQQRTSNGKGVTIPSQQRYVHYYDEYLKVHRYDQNFKPMNTYKKLKKIRFVTVPNFDVGGGCDPYVKIFRQDGKLFYDYRKTHPVVGYHRGETQVELMCDDVVICGDCKFIFFDEDSFSKDDKMFWCWMNTAFVKNNLLALKKDELDGAVKDKGNRLFDVNFTVEFYFEDVDPASVAQLQVYDEEDADSDGENDNPQDDD
eukprot:TRINITY_DN2754_c0_g3_i1.p1 TRINITY_DN2754_c0_g3~~TRINITY_DN2754_c0_g3_i1.p1  ORF type:complete len:223 (+),score=49.20 TRINITY_DN2754_c0_g3_i1:43-711(+)